MDGKETRDLKELRYSIEKVNDSAGARLIVAMAGRIIFIDLDRLEDDLNTALAGELCHVYFDFKNVDFIDSRGLDFLITFHKKLKKSNFNISIINVNDRIHELLHICFFHKLFSIQKMADTPAPA